MTGESKAVEPVVCGVFLYPGSHPHLSIQRIKMNMEGSMIQTPMNLEKLLP